MAFVRKSQRGVIFLLLCLCIMVGCCAEAETALPMVSVTGESLTGWEGKQDVREAELTYNDPATGKTFTQRITIRPQGTSSLGYGKKNFTIVFQEEGVELQPRWGAQTEYCLKANFIDPTHAGNVVSARLVGQMNKAQGMFEDLPNYGAIDGFPMWVTLNGEDAGLYTWNIPKAAWMFNMDESNPSHIVLCGESWNDGCMFRTFNYLMDEDWSFEVGEETAYTVERFDRLVSFIVDTSDEEFVRDFDQYLNLDACLNYICFASVTEAIDNVGKNMLMVTWDGDVWQPMLYDLDSLWGICYDGMKRNDTDRATELFPGGNRLLSRVWTLFHPQLVERYAFLRDGVLSEENIWAEFERFVEAIPEDAYERDHQLWNAGNRMIRTLDVMREQVAEYLPLVDEIMGYQAP